MPSGRRNDCLLRSGKDCLLVTSAHLHYFTALQVFKAKWYDLSLKLSLWRAVTICKGEMYCYSFLTVKSLNFYFLNLCYIIFFSVNFYHWISEGCSANLNHARFNKFTYERDASLFNTSSILRRQASQKHRKLNFKRGSEPIFCICRLISAGPHKIALS